MARDNNSKDIGTLETKGGSLKMVAFHFEGVSGVAFILQDRVKGLKVQVMLNSETFQRFRGGYRSALKLSLDAGESKSVGRYGGDGGMALGVMRRGSGPPHVVIEMQGPKGKKGIFLMNPAECGELLTMIDNAASAKP